MIEFLLLWLFLGVGIGPLIGALLGRNPVPEMDEGHFHHGSNQ
jgi:hypothetical protein